MPKFNAFGFILYYFLIFISASVSAEDILIFNPADNQKDLTLQSAKNSNDDLDLHSSSNTDNNDLQLNSVHSTSTNELSTINPILDGSFISSAPIVKNIGSVTGLSGLIRIPTADVLPEGQLRYIHTTNPGGGDAKGVENDLWLGWNDPISSSIGGVSHDALTLGLYPNLEISFSMAADGLRGNFRDLTAHLKYRIFDGDEKYPAIAIGTVDYGRNDTNSNVFAVASQNYLDNHLQATVGGIVGEHNGLLAGLGIRPTPWVELQAEYDSDRINVGLAIEPIRNLWLRAADVDLGTIYSASYTANFWDADDSTPIILDLPPSQLKSEEMVATAQAKLLELGMEDVKVALCNAADGQRLILEYENRRYTLNALDGIKEGLQIAALTANSEVSELEIQLRHLGITVIQLRTDAKAYREYRNGQLPLAKFAIQTTLKTLPEVISPETVIAKTERLNVPYGHTDIELGVGIRSRVGTELTRLSLGWWLQPEVKIPIGRGFYSSAKFQLPLAGPLASDSEQGLKLDQALLSYAVSPSSDWLTQVSAGRFSRERDGVLFEAAHPFGDAGLLRGTVGVLNHDLLGQGPYYTGEYLRWLSAANIQLRAVAGRFLDNDLAWGVDVSRYFDDLNISVGYRDSRDYGQRMELRVGIPLSHNKQSSKPATIRLRPADYLDYSIRTSMETPNYISLALLGANEIGFGHDLITSYMMRNRIIKDYLLMHMY